jgi:hypothetical protein
LHIISCETLCVSNSSYMDSLYGNEAMELDEDIQTHIEMINSLKAQVLNVFIRFIGLV